MKASWEITWAELAYNERKQIASMMPNKLEQMISLFNTFIIKVLWTKLPTESMICFEIIYHYRIYRIDYT